MEEGKANDAVHDIESRHRRSEAEVREALE